MTQKIEREKVIKDTVQIQREISNRRDWENTNNRNLQFGHKAPSVDDNKHFIIIDQNISVRQELVLAK